MESDKSPFIKKAKKKQVKDELDRIKQAEKKRRRLEKALATSAAIRSELEKKKQKKKEEQQRLDEEGAAIAEAVALHVLLGEDSDEMSRIVLKESNGFDRWNCLTSIGLFIESPIISPKNLKTCSFESMGGHLPNTYGPEIEWNQCGGRSNHSFSPSFPFLRDRKWGPSYVSAELIAAQAVSSLKIGEDVQVDTGFYNRY